MASGVTPDAPEAMEVAERHRAHITRWFYDCSREIHAGLGRMYVADARFTRNIDKAGEGLAAYMSAAIVANASRE
jgi:MerR family transcriptional regulator, thiopeptide resistance regulator